MEKFERVSDRLGDTPGERYANEAPGKHEMPDLRAVLFYVCHFAFLPLGLRRFAAEPGSRGSRGFRGHGQCAVVLGFHVIFCMYRLDE